MKVVNVKINNYRSLGEENNSLFISDVTCIIGKNESGKTNILEALSEVKMLGSMNLNYFRKNNRANGKEISIEFTLEPYKSEKEKYKNLADTKVFIDSSNIICIQGGISDVILNDKDFVSARENFLNLIKGAVFPFDENARKFYESFIAKLKDADTKIMVFGSYIDTIKNYIGKSQVGTKEQILNSIDICCSRLNDIYMLLPTMFFINSESLKTDYKREDIKSPKDATVAASVNMLKMFLQTAGIEIDLIEKYWSITNSGEKKDLLDNFNKLIEDNILSKFNNFYKQDIVSCSILLDNNILSIAIKTSGKSMEFSERSNGLKWYFNTFIKMLYSNLNQNNIVYILDEPGVFLHVNAQKELLKFFEDLSLKENQVIYTTHSPYMINQDDMGSIRLVSKENSLYTSISNSYNSFPTDPAYGSQETLTPLLYAIGLDLKYNIGPDSKKINIVVEGITDFYYLSAVKIMSNKKFYNTYIIPSVGASQINKIVSILIGWGFEYRVLLDNDVSGRDEYKVLIKKINVDYDNIIFTDGTRKLDTSANHEIENIFSPNDYKNIVSNISDYNSKKKIVSLDIYNRAKKGEKVFDKETLNNFELLINKIINKN